MNYRYEFDESRTGDLRLWRARYEIQQAAYRGLRDELEAWNGRVLEQGGASSPPYVQEVEDLNGMIAWGDGELAHARSGEIVVRGISVGSSRYAKAALTLAIHRRWEDCETRARQGPARRRLALA